MGDALTYLVVFFVSRFTSYALLAWDERRMTDDQRARAWPDASRLSAIFAFSVLAILVHYARTRRTVWGVLVGLAGAGGVMAVTLVAALAMDVLWPSEG